MDEVKSFWNYMFILFIAGCAINYAVAGQCHNPFGILAIFACYLLCIVGMLVCFLKV